MKLLPQLIVLLEPLATVVSEEKTHNFVALFVVLWARGGHTFFCVFCFSEKYSKMPPIVHISCQVAVFQFFFIYETCFCFLFSFLGCGARFVLQQVQQSNVEH